jgi:uncharacterized protein
MIKSFCHRFAAALLFAAALPACAASFDCAKAKQDFEKAVCSDKNLSSWDDKLSAMYRNYLGEVGDYGDVRADQRQWAATERQQCMADRSKANYCLAVAYANRYNYLREWVNAIRQPQKAETRIALNNVAKDYDFTLRMLDKSSGVLEVRRKGETQLRQSIPLDNVELRFGDDGKPLVNSNAMYEYGGIINAQDYNFDGKEDIAIQTGDAGPYGAPSYAIYLDTAKGFSFSSALTDLSQESLNSLEVEGNLLATSGKSGCCIHYRNWYRVVNDKPVEQRRVTLDSASDEKYDLTIEENWKDGKWVRNVQRERKADYCEDTLYQAAPGAQQGQAISCMLMPGNKKLGVIAYSTGDGKNFEVVLAKISDGTRLASYSHPKPLGGKIHELRLFGEALPLPGKEPAFRILTFFEIGKGDQWGIDTVLQRNGAKLVPLVDDLIANFSEKGAMRMRFLKAGESGLTVHEQVQTTSSATPVERDVTLPFDGTRYVVPADMLYKP